MPLAMMTMKIQVHGFPISVDFLWVQKIWAAVELLYKIFLVLIMKKMQHNQNSLLFDLLMHLANIHITDY